MHPDDLLAVPDPMDLEHAVRTALGLQSAPSTRRYRLHLRRVEEATAEVEASSAEEAMYLAESNKAITPIMCHVSIWTCQMAVDTSTDAIVFHDDEFLPF